MLKPTRRLIAAFLATTLPCTTALAQPVIPGAVGFGTETPAGRGGSIIPVNNLNDRGEGSLRACVEVSGPRICVFEVGGTIHLENNLDVSDPNLTIAGQTAPAPGIMLRGAGLVIEASDVLVQHIAIRPGDEPEGPQMRSRDAVKILGTAKRIENVVLDHCSLSWALDEVVEVWGHKWDNVTLSNNIISEPLREAPAAAGKDQGYGVLVDATPGRISFVGNLFAHVHNRTPRSAAEGLVFVNNVVYNAGIIQLNLYNENGLASDNSIVGNVFIRGSDTTAGMPVLLNGEGINGIATALVNGTEIFLSDNLADVGSSDPWSIVENKSSISIERLKAPEPPVWVPELEARSTEGDSVVDYVLGNAGSRSGERNDVDERVLGNVREGTGRIINCVADDGSSRCDLNAGGWPQLAATRHELDIPGNPEADEDGDGYTNVEEWLQDMAASVEGRSSNFWRGDAEDVLSPPKPPQLH